MKRILVATLAGAIVAHIWGLVSWMALSWHMDPLVQLTNEAEVAAAIAKGAPEGATMFLIPHPAECLAPDATEEAHKAHEEAFVKGPFAYGVVRTGEAPFNMGANVGKTFATNLVLALIAALILSSGPHASYLCRVSLVALIGLFAGIAGNIPNHIWWEHPLNFIGVNIADSAITWLLAGLAIAALIKPPSPSSD